MLGVGLRVIIDAAEGPATAMFNPRIEETSGRMVAGEEGNLCLPGVRAEVRRAQTVTVSWQTLAGQDRTETFHDWHARVLQHEIEILDGRLFLDHEGVQPLGTMPMPDAQAERAAALLFGEPEPERRRVEPVSVATFDPRSGSSTRSSSGHPRRPASSSTRSSSAPLPTACSASSTSAAASASPRRRSASGCAWRPSTTASTHPSCCAIRRSSTARTRPRSARRGA